jgi:orotidine-5'-phosphate decarboxylase
MLPRRMVKAADRLIVALDVPDVGAARRIVEDLGDAVSFYKVGYWLHAARGVDRFLDELTDGGKKVFWDIKGCDIPETLKGLTTCAAQRNFAFVTIHGNGDVSDEALRAADEGRRGSDLKILAVTVLTSLGEEDVQRFHRAPSVAALVEERARRVIAAGMDGVITSGREAARVRAIANEMGRPEFLIVTPGIRPAGAADNDQKRPVTPSESIGNGADYLVVGRPITGASDRKAAALAITEEMQRAFDARG